MKKILALLILLTCPLVYSQTYTTVTATLTDGGGQVWANASVSASIVPPFGNPAPLTNMGVAPISPVQVFANGSGVFSMQLDDNTVVTPNGSTWVFSICPNATVKVCSQSTQVIHGTTMNLSASLSADLTQPSVQVAPTVSRAYVDSEATAGQGAIYWRTSDNSLRGFDGTQWIPILSSGNVSPPWNNIQTPTGNLVLNMANFTTQFNMGTTGATGAAFDITDSSANSGTNYLLRVWTGTSSSAKTVAFCDNGTNNCVEFNAAGIFDALGSAQIIATSVLNTGTGVGIVQLGSNGSGSVSQANTIKLTGNSNMAYISENGGSLSKVLLGGQLTCGTSFLQSTALDGTPQCVDLFGGSNIYTGSNIMAIVRGIIPQVELATNTDYSGTLAFSGGTTSATYTFVNASVHNCTVTPQFNTTTTSYWVSSSGATLQITSSANLTGSFVYNCVGQVAY